MPRCREAPLQLDVRVQKSPGEDFEAAMVLAVLHGREAFLLRVSWVVH